MRPTFTRFAIWAGLWALLGAVSAPAHSLKVYSEFQRVDPFGAIVPADRARVAGVRPREILSPAVARNAFASFHLAVTVRPGETFDLSIGQNPEDSFGVTIYRERHVKLGDAWIPDGLEPITLPYTGKLPDPSSPIPGQTTVTFWMDLWVPFDAEVCRVKVEPQVYSEGYWVTYPMEVRVITLIVPGLPRARTLPAAVQESADTTARRVLHGHLCGVEESGPTLRRNLRQLILRNALQDLALAASFESSPGNSAVLEPILGVPKAGRRDWCDAPAFPTERGAEWYLRVRDSLYRMVN